MSGPRCAKEAVEVRARFSHSFLIQIVVFAGMAAPTRP